MADSARFELRLDDGVSAPAATARDALGKLRGEVDAAQKRLASMNKAMRQLRAGGQEGSTAFKELEQRIAAQKAQIAEATGRYVDLGGSFEKTRKAAKSTAPAIDKTTLAMGAMASVASVVVAALGAVAAASIAAGSALVAYGVRQADARRSELLRLEGLSRLRQMYRRAGASGEEMQGAIDRVADSSSASRSALEGMTARLQRMGLRGGNLTAALEGMAIASETVGERGANRFAAMAAAAARTGGNVRALADDIKARLGDLAERRLRSLDVLTTKWRENMDALFRNVEVDGFLKVLQEVVKAFSQSRVTGRALSGILTRLFAPLNTGAEGASQGVRRAFEVMVLGALRAEEVFLRLQIGVLRALRRISKTVAPFRSQFEGLFGDVDAANVFAAAILTVAGAIAALTAGVVVVGAIIAAPFIAAAAAGYGLVSAWKAVVNSARDNARAARRAWDALDFGEVASDLVDGFVRGITNGGARVVGAVSALGRLTVQALRTTLRIQSPSRVFADLGREIPRGLAVGIDAEGGTAEGSVTNMVDAAIPAPAPIAPNVINNGGARASVTIGELVFTSPATSTVEAARDFREQLAEVLEGLSVISGEAAA